MSAISASNNTGVILANIPAPMPPPPRTPFQTQEEFNQLLADWQNAMIQWQEQQAGVEANNINVRAAAMGVSVDNYKLMTANTSASLAAVQAANAQQNQSIIQKAGDVIKAGEDAITKGITDVSKQVNLGTVLTEVGKDFDKTSEGVSLGITTAIQGVGESVKPALLAGTVDASLLSAVPLILIGGILLFALLNPKEATQISRDTSESVRASASAAKEAAITAGKFAII